MTLLPLPCYNIHGSININIHYYRKRGYFMMNTQDTNQKKTLKKGRKGWVVAAALGATLGAGTM